MVKNQPYENTSKRLSSIKYQLLDEIRVKFFEIGENLNKKESSLLIHCLKNNLEPPPIHEKDAAPWFKKIRVALVQCRCSKECHRFNQAWAMSCPWGTCDPPSTLMCPANIFLVDEIFKLRLKPFFMKMDCPKPIFL